MKHMKKFVSLLLTVVMVLAMSMTAFAVEGEGDEETTSTNYSITINNSAEGHTYEAYQIFTGDLSETGVLSNIVWGSGITEAGQTALQNKYDTAETKSAAGVAEALTDENAVQFAKDAAEYLTTTKVESTYSETNKNYTISGLAAGYYLVKDKDKSLSGDDAYTSYILRVVNNTTVNPKSDVPEFEKKLKDTNDTTGETSGWQDSADWNIGDKVPFQLKGTVATNYDAYSTYYFAFHDVEETGLTFDSTSVKVYVDGTLITSGYEVVTNPTDGCTFEVVFSNLKEITSVHAGSVITVEYESTLNENANLGNQGNVNKAKLEFSNNPNQEQSGIPETGETPWDNVIVFTYQVVVNKYANSVDEANKLEGAEFTLEKVLVDGTKETIAVVKSSDGTSFTFKGLDDGNYILTETKTPDGYNTIDPITFTVTAEHTITWDGTNRTAVLTSLSGNAASGEITFTASENKDSLSTNVINKSGSTLPETGGMGTTIFYVLGTILVLGAAIMLIAKKRMNK